MRGKNGGKVNRWRNEKVKTHVTSAMVELAQKMALRATTSLELSWESKSVIGSNQTEKKATAVLAVRTIDFFCHCRKRRTPSAAGRITRRFHRPRQQPCCPEEQL